ncbi:hypothetical protein ANN_08683 [Periplaneta americana]|uniref:Cytochrome P450 n=1 Tax=Periplaneta americana TaxID=6978 RepID=A0ABQ8T3P6_PERAM|nr:hypothetical protein ANN_08683 [Periplaneta americana]
MSIKKTLNIYKQVNSILIRSASLDGRLELRRDISETSQDNDKDCGQLSSPVDGRIFSFIAYVGKSNYGPLGEKWRVHRKIITPTFHFKILEKYLDVFNKNGQILVERLASHASDQEEFDISSYITSFTLDVITESAMGVSVNAQTDDSSEYAKSVRGMSHVIMIRNFSPWQHSDLIFNLSPLGKLSRKCLTVIHGMTDYVINKRKKEIMQDMKERKCESGEDIVFESSSSSSSASSSLLGL